MSKHIGLRLGTAFAVLIAILVGIGQLGLRRTREINETLSDITGRRSAKVQLAREALKFSNRNSRLTMEIFLVQDRALIDRLLATRAENTRKISELVAEIERRCESEKEKQLLAAVETTRKPYIDSYLRALHLLVEEKKHDAAEAVMVNETLPALLKYHATWDEFVEFQQSQLDAAAERAKVDYGRARGLAYFLVALAVAVALTIALLVTRETVHRTGELTDANRQLARESEERRHAAQELCEREDRLRLILESTAEAIYGVDLEGRCTFCNPACLRLLGYKHSNELLGKNIHGLIHHSRADGTAISLEESPIFQAFKRGQGVHVADEVLWKADGTRFPAEYWSYPQRKGEEVVGAVVAFIDITERKVAEEALRESQQLFQSAFQHAGVGMALNDLDGHWLQVNPALCDFLGYSSSELLATNFQAVTHPDDLQQSLLSLRQLIARTQRVYQLEKRYLHKDGHVVWGLLTVSPVCDSEGNPVYVVAQIQDISKRKQAQDDLREREAQLQLLLDSTAEAIYGIDLDGKCTFSNRACLKLLGYHDPVDMLGKNMHTLVHHSHGDGSPFAVEECRIYRTFSQGGATHCDSEVLWKADGTSFPCEYWAFPVLREGKRVGCVVTFVDITARKQAEDALRRAHAQSELFINSVPSILIGTDVHGKITRWNLAAANTFAMSADQVRGQSLKDCGIRWIAPDIENEIDSWLAMEETSRHINLPFERDGARHFLGVAIHRVLFADETSVGLLITGADITERRHLEEQLRQAQKLEAIGQLAAGIAHEINTPTQYVGDNTTFLKQSWSAISEIARAAQRIAQECRNGGISAEATAHLGQCLAEGDLDYLLEEIPNAIDQSLEGVQRVAEIVRAMKEFSHPGAEEKSALDINRAIDTTITVARNEWKYVAEMETRFDPNLPLVHCHAGEFNQVILNLLINAAHAIRQVVGDGSGGRGKIVIATKGEQHWVEISIQDSGCGIPEDIQSRIFEPFFTTKPVGQGTGQGLALAHATIVRKHGGRIWFETTVGKGTTFFVSLPVSPLTEEKA